ncbi:hypothetical protein LINGRAHAP2_LOCUS23427, partial [Linum grandiflorum]
MSTPIPLILMITTLSAQWKGNQHYEYGSSHEKDSGSANNLKILGLLDKDDMILSFR